MLKLDSGAIPGGGEHDEPELVYEIARYNVSINTEVLVERVQVFSRDGVLRRRADDRPETRCTGTDVTALIGSDPLLNEVRANQVTRITAEPAALRELPLVLRVPGHGDDFDESQWSESMRDEHVTQEWEVQTGMYRVLYVNGERWSAWPTPKGERLLPEDWPLIRVTPCWGELKFCEEGATMTVGEDVTIIGPVTTGVIACATMPDEWADIDVRLQRRGNDAVMFVEWLLQGWLTDQYSGANPDVDVLLAQLFVEASINGLNGQTVSGSYLHAGKVRPRPEVMDGLIHDSSHWTLELDLEPAMVDSVLDLLARRGPQFSDIVTAARNRQSPAGVARRAALAQWKQQDHEGWERPSL